MLDNKTMFCYNKSVTMLQTLQGSKLFAYGGIMISKKELLKRTGISYGQLYRWKREELIPEEWFHKTSAPTGQETFFEEDQILPRIEKILELKDDFSIEEMRRAFAVSAVPRHPDRTHPCAFYRKKHRFPLIFLFLCAIIEKNVDLSTFAS